MNLGAVLLRDLKLGERIYNVPSAMTGTVEAPPGRSKVVWVRCDGCGKRHLWPVVDVRPVGDA